MITVVDSLLMRHKERRKIERKAELVKLVSITHCASRFHIIVCILRDMNYQFAKVIVVSMSYSF